jgi:hypothetical protein
MVLCRLNRGIRHGDRFSEEIWLYLFGTFLANKNAELGRFWFNISEGQLKAAGKFPGRQD